MREVLAQRPGIRIIARTSVPRWMFGPVAKAGVEIQAFETDTGVVQFDSLSLDEEQTARDAARFFAGFERRVATEAGLIRGLRANLVVGDIPPLACAAAERAAVPCVAIGNFTWDWIYEVYPAFDRGAPEVIPAIRRAYAGHDASVETSAAWRLCADGCRHERHPAHRATIGARPGGDAATARDQPGATNRADLVRTLRRHPAA